MRNKIKIKNNFTTSFFLVAGGTAFAQIIGILSSPIITRIYSPEEYGIFAVYASILTVFSGSECLRYELGIPIADDDESAINVLSLSLVILILSSLLMFIIISIFGNALLVSLSAESIANYKFLLPLGFLLHGLFQALLMWNFRKKAYKTISKTKIAQSIGGAFTKIGLGLLSLGPIGLIFGNIIGQSAGITTLGKAIVEQKKLINSISLNKMLYFSKRFIKFPLFQLPSTLLSKTTNQLPLLFIASTYGGEIVGSFGLAKSIVSIPVLLIGKSVGDVYYGEVAAIGRKDPGRVKEISDKLFTKLCIVGILPLIILVSVGPQLFGLVFGSEWIAAGEYARILAMLSYSELVFQPLSRVYDVFEKQHISLSITIMRIFLIIGVFYISKILYLDALQAIFLYVIIMIFIQFSTFIVARKILLNATKNA